jgi:hypothetical protein
MGTDPAPMPTIQWERLYPTEANLSELVQPITTQEITYLICSLMNNKSPGPDGSTGEFYKAFIDLLVPDILAVFSYCTLSSSTLFPLNSSHVVLIPKKEDVVKPQDSRSISLVHGIQKIFSKNYANRL